jgi:hypothetical protein
MDDVGVEEREREKREKEKKEKGLLKKKESNPSWCRAIKLKNAIGTQITVDGQDGRGCRRIPGVVVGRWEGTGCFCGYDEVMHQVFPRRVTERERCLECTPKDSQRNGEWKGETLDEPKVSFLTSNKLVEGRIRRRKAQNEVRFNWTGALIGGAGGLRACT